MDQKNELKSWDELHETYLKNAAQVADKNLKAGGSISYRDEKGNLVREYPDGTIKIIQEAE